MSSSSTTPTVTVLFRFRDMIADTVREHRVLIAQHKTCWWGWWKRPTEHERRDIWDHLMERLALEGRVAVGLFDSGADSSLRTVHVAWVTELKPPGKAHDGSLPTVQLDEAEKELIPTYYRDSVFSRAWIRLDEIQTDAIEFFGRYSYADPPPLPGIPKAELNRLRDKVVVDRDELRAMDTTIWRVRERRESDAQDRFLSSSIRIDGPVSAEPVRVRGSKILHLSDLHFADDKHRGQHRWRYPGENTNLPTLAESVSSCLTDDEGNSDVGVLVVTGDFTFLASTEEFEMALRQIASLQGALDLGPDEIVLVPGNHDIRWTEQAEYDGTSQVTQAPAEATAAYRSFYAALLRHDADDDLCMGRRFIFDNGVVVDFCALNSSSLAQGAHFLAGMGQMPQGAFKRIAKRLGWDHEGASLRVLAMHHHLVPTEDVEDPADYYRGFGMANDAQRTLRDAAGRGVALALHGHRHRTFVWRSGVYQLPDQVHEKWEIGEVNILGCGSTGSTEAPANANFFNLLTPSPGRLDVEMYRSTNGGDFARMRKWSASLTLAPGCGLRVGPWSPAEP